MNVTYDYIIIRDYVYKRLEKDDICKGIFECWVDGMEKPPDIRELHGFSESDFNNGKKRLTTVLKDIRTHFIR